MKLNYLYRFSKNTEIANFMIVCPVGSRVVSCVRTEERTDGQTDAHDETIVFRNFVNPPKLQQRSQCGLNSCGILKQLASSFYQHTSTFLTSIKYGEFLDWSRKKLFIRDFCIIKKSYFRMQDIPLCSAIYKVNRLFIVAFGHINSIFGHYFSLY